MTAEMRQDSWAMPVKSPEGLDAELLERWNSATGRIAQLGADMGWSKSEIARRAGISIGTFSQWYSASYAGRYDKTTDKVELFIASVEEMNALDAGMPTEPDFVETRLARELFQMFIYAQKLPTMAIATVVSGMGKTTAARRFQATRPHVFVVTLSPSSGNPHTLKVEIAQQLGISAREANTLKGSITDALSRDGFSALLIVDEAQNLNEACINELRHFRDCAGCGLVLLGNDEASTPYASKDVRHSSPQVSRRIGVRMSVLEPYAEDIRAYLDAWGLEGDDLRKVATAIASKRGALGALDETIKAAAMIASGNGRPLGPDDLREAYALRGQGGV